MPDAPLRPEPFRPQAAPADLADLRARLCATRWPDSPLAQHARRVEVPSGFSLIPADIARPPRAWLERTANVVRVTELPRGGHFAPFEEPELYAQELRAFFRPYRRI